MTTRTVDGIAALIREVDGDNLMAAKDLAFTIAGYLGGRVKQPAQVDLVGVADFIERTNPDKKLGAGALAELLVAEFELDKEH